MIEHFPYRPTSDVNPRLALVIHLLCICALLPNPGLATETGWSVQASPLSINVTELERFLDVFIPERMETHRIPGVQFIMVKDGQIILAKGYGFADLDNKIPVDPRRTLFRICSIAKVVTGTAVMQLAEKNRLDLNRDVNDYLTRFKVNNPFPRPVTTQHLLTHTPGFDDVYIHKSVRRAEDQPPLGEFLAQRLPPVITPPGEVYTYSNLGNALAGYLVEALSEQDFADYVTDHIFKPLGMRRSSFRLPDSLAPDLAKGYWFENGEYTIIPFDFLNDYPAGQMISTAGDMARFMIAHLQKGHYDGKRILEGATTEAMHQVQFTHHPRLQGAMGHTFAIGWVRGQKLLAHDGGYLGASTRLWLFPESQLGIYMACNILNGQLNNEVTYGLAERIFPETAVEELSFPPEPIPEYDGDVVRFSGTYRQTRYTHGTLPKVGILMNLLGFEFSIGHNQEGMIVMNDLQGRPRRMIQIEPLLFQSIDDNYFCAFRQDQQGRVTHLFTNGTTAFEKVPWYYTVAFQQKVFLFCFTVFAVTAIGAPLLRRIRKKPKEDNPLRKQLNRYALLSGNTFLMYLLAFGATVFLFIPAYEMVIGFAYGLPDMLYLVQILPFLGIVFVVLLSYYSVKIWFVGQHGFFSAMYFSLASLTGILFIWFLYYWNLLGWRF